MDLATFFAVSAATARLRRLWAAATSFTGGSDAIAAASVIFPQQVWTKTSFIMQVYEGNNAAAGTFSAPRIIVSQVQPAFQSLAGGSRRQF
jgi:hypothetical protein